MTAPLAGTGLLARIALRTGWKGLLAWIVGLVGLFAVTGLSIRELFATPEQLAGYALALGDSMIMINGRIAGLDTAGGETRHDHQGRANSPPYPGMKFPAKRAG